MTNIEWFDVVDQNDKVIGRATREEAHARGLLHRAVHIMVFNSRGELFVQKRALTKDENPGLLDTSSAGHVSAGDDYVQTAHRELEEELGIKAELRFFSKVPACIETAWEHLEVFTCVSDQNIVIDKNEISEGRFWTLEELRNALNERRHEFTSSFRLIWKLYSVKK